MSTIAPERTEALEDTALLQRLDPDNATPCETEPCEREAAFRLACKSCGHSVAMCGLHTLEAIGVLEVHALLHVPESCVECQVAFCAHRWRSHVAIVDLGTGS